MARSPSIREQVANRLGLPVDDLARALERYGADIEGALLSFGTELADLFTSTGKVSPRTRRALRRTYGREYQRRVRQAEEAGVTRKVARGHGPVPLRIAKRLESLRAGTARKPLPKATREKYRRGIAEYERTRWGSFDVGGHTVGVTKKRQMPVIFPTEEIAREFLRESGYDQIPDDYINIHITPAGDFIVEILS